LYKTHAEERIAFAQGIHPDLQSRLAALRMEGGTSLPAALGLVAVWFALMAGVTVLAMQQIKTYPVSPGYTGLERQAPATGNSSTLGSAAAPAADDQFLIGVWGDGNCSGNRIQFLPGNQFVADRSGVYLLSGSTLTLTVGGEQMVAQVQMVDAATMILSISGRQSRFVRC